MNYPCYQRNPWLKICFCRGRLHLRRWHWSEEYPQGLFPADYPDQFMDCAIHGDEDEQNDLDGPEMRPDDFRQQLFVAVGKAASLPPKLDQTFNVMDGHRNQPVDNG